MYYLCENSISFMDIFSCYFLFQDHIIPETTCASDVNAPLVLATALKCLIPLIDLCAPRTLLSTLRLAKQNQNFQSNDCVNSNINVESEINHPNTSQASIHQQECLLPILLDLSKEIAKVSCVSFFFF